MAEQVGVLEFTSTKLKPIKLTGQVVIIGRDKGDIVIPDHAISSTHCQIQKTDKGYTIFDMNSSNGTFVNNERIVRRELQSGDIITIGSSQFTFTLVEQKQARSFNSATQINFVDMGFEKTKVVDSVLARKEKIKHKIKLDLSYANGTRESIIVEQQSLLLGRGSAYGQLGNDVGISRSHLVVKVNESQEIFVEDQGSTNGSFINDQKITGIHMVSPNDVVTIGSTKIRFTALKG